MKEFLDQFVHGKKTYFVAAMALGYLAGGYMGWWAINDEVLKAFGFGAAITLRHAIAGISGDADSSSSPSLGASQKGGGNANGITTALGMAFVVGLTLCGCSTPGGMLSHLGGALSDPKVTVVTNNVTVVQTNYVAVPVQVPGQTIVQTNFVERFTTNVVERVSTVTNFVEKAGIETGMAIAKAGASLAPPPYNAIAAGVLAVVSGGLGFLVKRKNDEANGAAAENESLGLQLRSVVQGVEQVTSAIDAPTGVKVKGIIAETSKALGVSDDLHATVKALTEAPAAAKG